MACPLRGPPTDAEPQLSCERRHFSKHVHAGVGVTLVPNSLSATKAPTPSFRRENLTKQVDFESWCVGVSRHIEDFQMEMFWNPPLGRVQE